jgi:hypothetical protein
MAKRILATGKIKPLKQRGGYGCTGDICDISGFLSGGLY